MWPAANPKPLSLHQIPALARAYAAVSQTATSISGILPHATWGHGDMRLVQGPKRKMAGRIAPAILIIIPALNPIAASRSPERRVRLQEQVLQEQVLREQVLRVPQQEQEQAP